MKRYFCVLLSFVLLADFSSASEKRTHVQFLPNTPVNLQSEVAIEVSQSLPGLSLSTKGKQSLNAVLTVNGSHSDMPVTHPPLDLTFELKKLRISLWANNEELTFDSDDLEPSLYLSQVSKLVGQPIHLHFGKNFQLESGGGELKQTMRELPVLQEVNPEALLMDLFLSLFALGGEELTEGKVVERQYNTAGIPSLPNKVKYTITSIDDYNIKASIQGDIEKQTFSLSGKVMVNEKEDEFVKVTLNGTMEGSGKWNRDNAMLYDLEVHYLYTAMFRLGEWEWMMNADITVHNSTKLKN